MIEPLPDLPDGILGFRFSGHVSRDEHNQVLAPPLKERIEAGDRIRAGPPAVSSWGPVL